MALSIYTDGYETVIAESCEDAEAVRVETVGEERGYGGAWRKLEDDEDVGILIDPADDDSGWPEGTETVEMLGGFIRATAKARDWCAFHGRMYLASTEY